MVFAELPVLPRIVVAAKYRQRARKVVREVDLVVIRIHGRTRRVLFGNEPGKPLRIGSELLRRASELRVAVDDLVADRIHDHARMVAVCPHPCPYISLAPQPEQMRIAVRPLVARSDPPLVEDFVLEEQTHFVTKFEQSLVWRIV